MARTIEIDDLADFLQQEFTEYTEQVNAIVEDECKKVANEVKNELANNPNIPQSNASQKHYKKSFAIKKWADGRYTIYNKKPQLTHLLENGHDIYANGVNTGRRTKAFPHWEQANAKVANIINTLRQRLEANR